MAISKMRVIFPATLVVITLVGMVVYNVVSHSNPGPDLEQPNLTEGESPRVSSHADDKTRKTPSIAERFRALLAEYSAEGAEWSARIAAAKTDAERAAIPPLDEERCATKMWKLVEEAPTDPAVFDVCGFIAVYHCWSTVAPNALTVLRQHLKDPRIGALCREFAQSPDVSAEEFLRTVKTENSDPAVQNRAALALASHLCGHVLFNHSRGRLTRDGVAGVDSLNRGEPIQERLPLDPAEEVRLIQEVETICEAIQSQSADEPWVSYFGGEADEKTTMGAKAQEVLDFLNDFDVRRLSPGQLAPEIIAADSEGISLKLSDFRGKVTLISFVGQACKPCRAMIPHERELVDKMANRPFCLIGFDRSTDEATNRLKDFLTAEKVTWRVCAGRSASSGDVFRGWNVQAIPVFYLLDDRGMIRQRFDGYTERDVLDPAIESLVREAEQRNKGPTL